MINESKTLGADADQAARLGWTTRQSRVNPNPLPPVTAVDRCAAGFGWRGGDPSTQIGEFTLTCGGISPLTMVDIIGSAPLLNFDPHPGLIPNCTLVGNGINCTGSAPPEGPVALSVFPASPGQSFNVGAGFGDGHAESWLLTLP